MKTLKFELGEFEEGHSWDIQFNRGMCQEMWADSKTRVCKHCKDVETEIMRTGKHQYTSISFVIPRVVTARTNGGHSYTTVCLDCILEAAAKIGGE